MPIYHMFLSEKSCVCVTTELLQIHIHFIIHAKLLHDHVVQFCMAYMTYIYILIAHITRIYSSKWSTIRNKCLSSTSFTNLPM